MITEIERTFYSGNQKIIFDEIFNNFNLYRRPFFHMSVIGSAIMSDDIQEHLDKFNSRING